MKNKIIDTLCIVGIIILAVILGFIILASIDIMITIFSMIAMSL